jgi:hypothetical protein
MEDKQQRDKIGILVEKLREVDTLDLSEYISDKNCVLQAINLICLQQMGIESQQAEIERLEDRERELLERSEQLKKACNTIKG